MDSLLLVAPLDDADADADADIRFLADRNAILQSSSSSSSSFEPKPTLRTKNQRQHQQSLRPTTTTTTTPESSNAVTSEQQDDDNGDDDGTIGLPLEAKPNPPPETADLLEEDRRDALVRDLSSGDASTSSSSSNLPAVPRLYPRTVHWDNPDNNQVLEGEDLVDFSNGSKNRVVESMSLFATTDDPQPLVSETATDDNDERSSEASAAQHTQDQRQWDEECIPMVHWHTQSFPLCNALHEINIPLFLMQKSPDDDANDRRSAADGQLSLLSTQGSWRSVWKLESTLSSLLLPSDDEATEAGVSTAVVLKLLKFHRDFNEQSFDHHRVDALAMERLTSSRHIVDIYGYCGQSVLSEFAPDNARTAIKNESLTPFDRLVMGRDLALALADLHSIDYPNATNVTLTHNDVNMANLVHVDGHLKLNDFNIGILQRWNATVPSSSSSSSSSICRTPVRFSAPLWKSPEEILNASAVDAAATDVYGLGNLLFQVLTKRQPWTHLEPEGPLNNTEVAMRKCNGRFPFVPDKYRQNVNSALYFAVLACFRKSPHDRPTAFQIAQRLDAAIQWLQAYASSTVVNKGSDNKKRLLEHLVPPTQWKQLWDR